MDAEQRLAFLNWIMVQGLAGQDCDSFLSGICERLSDDGVGLKRVMIGLDTVHPIVEGRGIVWQREADEVVETEYNRGGGDEADEKWRQSPWYRLEQEGLDRLRRRLRGGDYRQGEFPMLDELQAEGATDYAAYITRFHEVDAIGEVEGVYSSWTSDADGGFTDLHLETIEATLPALALAVKADWASWTAKGLMATYLGADAGRRVIRGEIERGNTMTMRAIIWLSDLRGFTRITDTAPVDQLVPLLNDYAEVLVAAIHGHGGQVLKFMGDGILAFFKLEDGACTRALNAAETALAAARVLSRKREGEGLPTTRVGIGLHVGDVLYGNIGSSERLDFTVVGPAVNETSRIEALCRQLEQDIIVSETFATAEPDCRERLVALGRYMLRGVGRPQELFTLDPDAEPAFARPMTLSGRTA